MCSPVRNIVKEAVSGEEDHVPVLDTELVLVSRLGPVRQHLALQLRGRQRQLEWRVEVMLLLVRPADTSGVRESLDTHTLHTQQ